MKPVITADQQCFIRLYYVWTFLSSAYFPLGVSILYYHNVIGLSLTAASLLMIASWVTTILFDAYGGSLADKYGHRRMYTIGTLIYLSGTVVPVLFLHNFYLLCLLALVGGFGNALSSNALSAQAADILHDHKKRFQQLNANGQMMLFLSRTVATIAGGWLYAIAPPLPFVAFAASCLLGIIAVGRMPKYAQQGHQTTVAAPSILKVAAAMRKNSPYVWRVIAGSCLCSFALNILFIHYQPYFASAGFSAVSISYVLAGVSLASALGSWMVQHLHMRQRRLSIIFWSGVVVGVTGVAFMFGTTSVVLPMCIGMGVVSGMIVPTMRLAVTEHSHAKVRATALSVATTLTSTSIMLAFFTSGFLGDHSTSNVLGAVSFACCLAYGVVFVCKYRLATQRPVNALEDTA